jgi:hypothetical protein
VFKEHQVTSHGLQVIVLAAAGRVTARLNPDCNQEAFA